MRCGTDGYLAPELLGVLPRRHGKGSQYTYALDLWSLGCIVHQLLTSTIPFLETENEDDDITGLETSCEMIDMTSLLEYCHGQTDFSSEILENSQAPQGAIELVQSLLIARPSARATAASALLNRWVAEPAYTSRWCKDLESDFSRLGVKLRLPRDRKSRKQLRSVGIATVLPLTTNLLRVLQKCVIQGYDTAASMILKSPSLESMNISVVQDMIKRGFAAGLTQSLKSLLSLSKYGNLASCDQLLQAVNRGWVDIVQLLLDSKVNVNARIDGKTVLHVAAEHGNLDITKLLLTHGATFDALCNSGNTALYSAAARGHLEVVKLLFGKQAEVNPDDTHHPALYLAARAGHLDVVIFLLHNKVDVNSNSSKKEGRTALQAASECGHLEIVRLLLNNKASVNTPTGEDGGLTALQWAAGSGHIEIVKLLLDNKADINAPGSLTALQAAAGCGHLEIVKLLLYRKAHINAPGGPYGGRTALQWAAGNGQLDIVQLLLHNNADVNAPGDSYGGRSALHWAAGGGNIEIVQLLLNNRADVNSLTNNGDLAVLGAAVRGRCFGIVKLLLENFADPNTHGTGWTALQIAVTNDDIEIVMFLLSTGAQVNATSTYTVPPLLIAARRRNSVLVKLLLHNRAAIRGPEMMAEMTSCGYDVVRRHVGDNPLCIVACSQVLVVPLYHARLPPGLGLS